MEKMERGAYKEALGDIRLAMASLVSPPCADTKFVKMCMIYGVAIHVLSEIGKLAAAPQPDKARLAVLGTFLAGLPLKKAHRRACLAVAATHSDSGCRSLASLVPDCAALASVLHHRPPVAHTCRSCRSSCDAALPRCHTCGTAILVDCQSLRLIEDKSYAKCGTCMATFSSSTTTKCPLCTIGTLSTTV
jgi:hypothetical protein